MIEELEAQRGGSSTVRLTQTRPAVEPSAPTSPRPALNLAVGLLVGLAGGLALAVLRERLDTTVRGRRELDEVLHAPHLGAIGVDKSLERGPLAGDDLLLTTSEQYRTLRTNLQFVDVDHPVTSMVITSAGPGEGKTTTACNLAVALARSGVRVCLVDADLRRPSVSRYMGLEGEIGLADVVVGTLDLDDALLSWGGTHLSVLPAGMRIPDPNSLLASERMARTLRALGDRFDVVVVDAPPLGPVTDAAILAQRTDGLVVVARHGRTRRQALSEVHRQIELARARVLGTVLTFAPRRGADGYGYGYASDAPVVPEPIEPARLAAALGRRTPSGQVPDGDARTRGRNGATGRADRARGRRGTGAAGTSDGPERPGGDPPVTPPPGRRPAVVRRPAASDRALRVLVVCQANVCRSRAATVLLRQLADAAGVRVSVRSAGTRTVPGMPRCEVMDAVLLKRGPSSPPTAARARLDAEQLGGSDLVLVAETAHRAHAARLLPASRTRTFTVLEAAALARALRGGQVARTAPAEGADLRAVVEEMHAARGRVDLTPPASRWPFGAGRRSDRLRAGPAGRARRGPARPRADGAAARRGAGLSRRPARRALTRPPARAGRGGPARSAAPRTAPAPTAVPSPAAATRGAG